MVRVVPRAAAVITNRYRRIPLGLQMIPGLILCVGSIFIPFSPRWLMLKGKFYLTLVC